MPSHVNKPKFEVKEGDVFIAASNDSAFAKAYINASQVEVSLLNHWFNMRQTESEWKEIFLVASRAKRDYESTTNDSKFLITSKDIKG